MSTSVYFIVGAGLTKIGASMDVERRLRDLQAASPVELRLAGSFEGSWRMETWLHGEYAHLRRHGEWFEGEWTPELVEATREHAYARFPDRSSSARPVKVVARRARRRSPAGECLYVGCERGAVVRGRCRKHYQQLWRYEIAAQNRQSRERARRSLPDPRPQPPTASTASASE